MKRSVYTILVSVALLLASCSCAWAIKATAKIVKYRQPDGSVVCLKVAGDEFFGYTTTLQGHIVSVGPDGFLHNADYSTAVVRSQARRLLDPQRPAAIHTRAAASPFCSSLVLLVQFSDLQFTIEEPGEYFQEMLNGKNYTRDGATGSVAEYFNANFRGTCEFSFELSEVITLSKEAAYYGEHTPYMNDANVTGLVVEACKIASENGVDFSKYDTDSDGVVDNVAIIFAGLNEAESGNSNAIWPHKGDIADKNIFCNGVKIASYTCSSEYSGDAGDNWPATIGSFCHEYAHWLGLVDMYDVNDQEEGLSNGLYGTLSLMDRGNYLNNGKTPPYFNAIELEMLGLLPVADLCPDRDYRLSPVFMADTLYRAASATPGEYFLFECRNATGWDKYTSGQGLVVYHLDKSENMYGGLTAAARWRLNVVNSYAGHECAKVLCGQDWGEPFYPGTSNITSLTATSEPAFTDWQHSGLGISIADIAYDGNSSTFSVKEDLVYSSSVPGVQDFKIETFQSCAAISWSIPQAWGDMQQNASVNTAASRAGAYWALSLESDEGTVYKGSLAASCRRFLFEGLEPGKSCRGKIYMVEEGMMGDVHTFEFSTDPVTSEYPFVKLSGNYRVGDVLYVFVQNLVEEHSGIQIVLDGEKLQGNFYEFSRPGVHELEVLIKYPDSSMDVITKRIEVKN